MHCKQMQNPCIRVGNRRRLSLGPLLVDGLNLRISPQTRTFEDGHNLRQGWPRKNIHASKPKKLIKKSVSTLILDRVKKKKRNSHPLKFLTHETGPLQSGIQSYTLHIIKETPNQEIKELARALVAGRSQAHRSHQLCSTK